MRRALRLGRRLAGATVAHLHRHGGRDRGDGGDVYGEDAADFYRGEVPAEFLRAAGVLGESVVFGGGGAAAVSILFGFIMLGWVARWMFPGEELTEEKIKKLFSN